MKLFQVAAAGVVGLSIATGSALAGMPADYHVRPLPKSEQYDNGIIESNFHAKAKPGTASVNQSAEFGLTKVRLGHPDWWTRCQEAIASGQPVPFDARVNAFCALGPQR